MRRRGSRLVVMLTALVPLAACGTRGRSTDRGPTDPADFPVPPIDASRSPLTTAAASSGRLPARFGFGEPASTALIDSLDIDVQPDGNGLPPGHGTVAQGAAVFALHCASCHGPTGLNGPERPLVTEPKDRIPGFPFGQLRYYFPTVGNYWPYAPTLFSYIRKAMPQDGPGSLDSDQVYAVVAYLLWRNGIIDRDSVMNAGTLPRVVMPARGRFVVDPRRGGPEVH